MNSYIRKYTIILTSIILLLFLYSSATALPVGSQQTQRDVP